MTVCWLVVNTLLGVVVWTCITPALFGQQDVHAALIPPANRKSAPAFQLVTEDGTKMQISDYRGKVVLLNFWAADCGDCVLDIDMMRRRMEA
jgi:thiol-disulfide isomerase/thioredoxin